MTKPVKSDHLARGALQYNNMEQAYCQHYFALPQIKDGDVLHTSQRLKSCSTSQCVKPQKVNSRSFFSSFFRELSRKNTARDIVLFQNWYFLGVKKKFKPHPQKRGCYYLQGLLHKISDEHSRPFIWVCNPRDFPTVTFNSSLSFNLSILLSSRDYVTLEVFAMQQIILYI